MNKDRLRVVFGPLLEEYRQADKDVLEDSWERRRKAEAGIKDAIKKMVLDWALTHGVEANVYLELDLRRWNRPAGIDVRAIAIWNSKGAIGKSPWLNKLTVTSGGGIRAQRAHTDPDYLLNGAVAGFPEFVKELSEALKEL